MVTELRPKTRKHLLTALVCAAGAVLLLSAAGPGAADVAPDSLAPGNVTLSIGAGASVAVPATLHLDAAPPKADIILAVDTTGSMGGAIADAKADAVSIVGQIKTSIPGARFAVVDLKDYPGMPFGSPSDFPYLLRQALTSNSSLIDAAVNAMTAGGGGDGPESYNRAVFEAYSDTALGRDTDAPAFLVFLGDEFPHDAGQNTHFSSCPNTPPTDFGRDAVAGGGDDLPTNTVLDAAKANNINVSMVVYNPTTNVTACWGQLTTHTGGQRVTRTEATTLTSQIVNLIEEEAAKIDEVTLTVREENFASWLSSEPATVGPVTAPLSVEFEETITVPSETAPGSYTFHVDALADGAVRGTQTVTVLVEHGPNNTSWPNAFALSPPATESHFIDQLGQARWYKFPVAPSSDVTVKLTGLPANYDFFVFKDIGTVFDDLASTNDLNRLGAEFAADAYAPSAFSPSAFSPSAFSPADYTPSAFSPSVFSPSAFSPSAFSPSAFSPSAFSPSAFSPSAFSPSAFSPSAFSPSAFSPSAFSPSAFSPEAYSSAMFRSLIGLSARDGTAEESITLNTWNNRSIYVAVTGRNGAFDLSTPFDLDVDLDGNVCTGVGEIGSAPAAAPVTTVPITGGSAPLRTVILADLPRMPGLPADKTALGLKLQTFAQRPEVAGLVVNLNQNTRISDLNTQADSKPACPYAKNLVAEAARDVVDAYDANNQVDYVVVAGDDDVVPFFRHPDEAGLGPEENYFPPVGENTISRASHALNYVLSDDGYGALTEISSKSSSLPLPERAVGRLIETPPEVIGMLDAYLGTANGTVPTPKKTLVTGYDFLTDAANAIQTELSAGVGTGTGVVKDTLITDSNVAPSDIGAPPTKSWTATHLRTQLAKDHDLAFLAGHFSANNTLAADYATTVNASEFLAMNVDRTNAIYYSAGCHSGYNIVDDHGINGVTEPVDWAQVFARKRATLIAGTGYQYGDTDFLEYSERLYLNFTRELRYGTGPISVGQALMRAKQKYLGETPRRGIHDKALLEATLFGLPMLRVDLPGRVPAPSGPSIVSGTTSFTTNPGSTLGLSFANVFLSPITLSGASKALNNLGGTPPVVTASYLQGADGVVTNPGEPVLPLQKANVTVPGQSLRGVGFMGGTYSDTSGITPLTGAPTTEIRGVHTPFASSVFYPLKFWTANYFDALLGGATRLMVTPVQHKSDPPPALTNTRRQFSDVQFRLFYSNSRATFGANTPALAAPPTIANVRASAGDPITFDVSVVGDPSAGIQDVWITYTTIGGSLWQSLSLTQDAVESSRWHGSLSLPAGVTAGEVRYVVQAVNGVGLVSLVDNNGAYFTPGQDPGAGAAPTTLVLQSPPASGRYGQSAAVSALLRAGGSPLANKLVTFDVGGSSRTAFTAANGVATVNLPLLASPRAHTLTAGFEGEAAHLPSSASTAFTILRQPTTLTLAPLSATGTGGLVTSVTAALTANGLAVPERTVVFVLKRANGSVAGSFARTTDGSGVARLGAVLLGSTYGVTAYFGGTIPLPTGSVTIQDPLYEQSVSATGSITLTYAFDGFKLPVENPPTLNRVPAGSLAFLRWSLGGNFGPGILAANSPQSVAINCGKAKEKDVVENTSGYPINPGLYYLGFLNQYIYVWKTESSWKGSCRQFILTLNDGTVARANFKFK